MILLASSFSGKPRQASMAAYRQLLAENHVEDILQDVKQNKNLDRKKELPVWLPLAECFTNGVRKAEDAVASGLYFLDIDEKGLTEQLWNKVREENLIEEFRIVYFAESADNPNYKGIAYEKIVQALLWKLGYGDAPAEGERNTALYTMSRYLRFICDFDEQKLFAILPHWGLSDHEVLSTIKSAVASVRPTDMPSQMKEVLASLGAAMETSSENDEESLITPVNQELPGQQRVARDKDHHLSMGERGSHRKNRHQPLAQVLLTIVKPDAV
jgi:hypothetical protein